MRVLITLIVLIALTGCATHEIKVNCDGKLQPVNAASQVTQSKVAS